MQSNRNWLKRVAAASLTVAMGLAMPAASFASQEADTQERVPGLYDVVESLPVPTPARVGTQPKPGGKSLWVWPQGRRGFQVADAPLGSSAAAGYETVVSYDLDSGAEVTRQTVRPRIFRGKAAPGMPHIADVADAEGLFVAGYESTALSPAANGTVSNLARPGATEDDLRNRELNSACLLVDMSCFGGVLVMDAQTLEVRKRIPFTPISVDGGALGATLRAIHYVEPGAGGIDAPKILAVVEEWVHTPLGVSQVEQPRYQGANIVYVVQFDAERGVQDWAVRADGCRGAREPKDAGSVGTAQFRPNPAAVFRARTGADAHPAIVVACHSGSSQTGVIVEIPLNAEGAPEVLPASPADDPASAQQATAQQDADAAQGLVVQNATQQLFTGPDKVWEVFPDPTSGRVLMKVIDGSPTAEVWWVFDTKREQFIGTIGIGAFTADETQAVLDPARGRLYVVTPGRSASGASGGIFVADIRRTPVPQALVFPELGRNTTGGPPAVDPPLDGRPGRLYTRVADDLYKIVVDTLPVSVDGTVEDFQGRTLDLDEVEGVTQSVFDGAVRGYGVRALLVGGADTALRAGALDPTGQVYATQKTAMDNTAGVTGASTQRAAGLPVTSPCTEVSREIVLGSVGPSGPAVVDASGSRAGAEPIVVDSGLRTDVDKPLSRCAPVDWSDLWGKALFARPPVAEPRVDWPFGAGGASCVSSAESPNATFADPTTGWFSASVSCSDQDVSGWSRARAIDIDDLGLSVGEASSKFTVYRDPARGVVSRVESAVRGIELPQVLRVDSVRVVAESWANGRRQPVAAADQEAGYDPDCDMDRTAGTCFVRRISGVWTPAWSCGPCGDDAAMVEGLNRALAGNGKVALREPDPRMAAGSANGYIAAIQKPDHERFADLVLNNDLLQTVVPGLEIIRYTAANRTLTGGGPRGRQVYQFAGVEVSSTYGIACLLVYDAEGNTCAAAKEPPGSITVSLADTAGKPLAGGAFEVRLDGDGDGVAGLKDALIPNGACLTAADGVGTCKFDALQPGAYLVTQIAAPPGFAKQADPHKVDLASGEARTVAFQNASNVSVVQVKATDEAGKPLAGAVFSVMPDPDADGKVAADAKPAASCTTDASGSCAMRVPVGSYVLVQTGAPGGLEPIAPVAFTLASGGQTAAVGVVNYPQGLPAAPPAAAPVYSEPVAAAPPVETVEAYTPPVPEEAEGPVVDVPQAIGGTIVRIIAAPGDTLRLLAREPKEAVAWIASLALFAAALLAVRRRQAAAALIREQE